MEFSLKDHECMDQNKSGSAWSLLVGSIFHMKDSSRPGTFDGGWSLVVK